MVSVGLYQNINRLDLLEEDILRVWVSSDEFKVLSKLNEKF